MKKIRLNPDALEVVSFTTEQVAEVRGTVEAANTGNPCYVTVAYQNTLCLAYPVSYWNERTCLCPVEPVTRNLACPIDTADATCLCPVLTNFTCPGRPGC